jgi:hypothetical protein
MVVLEASVDEEVLPYLEHFLGILGSMESVVVCSLRAYFASMQPHTSVTHETFERLLLEEKDRVVGAMRARDDKSTDGDTVFTLELEDELGSSLEECMRVFKTSPDEIFHTAILALSVIEDMLETDPDAYFMTEDGPLPLSLLFQQGLETPSQLH